MEVIPHEQHRYCTAGDYWIDNERTLQIRSSALPDNRQSLLILLHEMVEVLQTEQKEISEPEIKAFDEKFEAARAPGNEDEPGDDDAAPYVFQHAIATSVERMMCALLGCSWKEYEKKCVNLFEK